MNKAAATMNTEAATMVEATEDVTAAMAIDVVAAPTICGGKERGGRDD